MTKLSFGKLPGFKAGQTVNCTVTAVDDRGYLVNFELNDGRQFPGFLATDQVFRLGDRVLAKFVCLQDSRALLLLDQGDPVQEAQTLAAINGALQTFLDD